MSVRGWFVAGTDTGVGKTYVAAQLTRRARARGLSVFAFKPIETGCVLRDGEFIGLDQEELSTAADVPDLRPRFRFERPVAASVAAREQNVEVDLDEIAAIVRMRNEEFVVVESAGGWRSPIRDDADTGSLARVVGLPVMVVSRAGLGAINHSLLTVEAVARDGLSVEALVLSRRSEDSLELAMSNMEEIARRWSGRVIVLGDQPDVLDTLL